MRFSSSLMKFSGLVMLVFSDGFLRLWDQHITRFCSASSGGTDERNISDPGGRRGRGSIKSPLSDSALGGV
jgi:hypothetical protein